MSYSHSIEQSHHVEPAIQGKVGSRAPPVERQVSEVVRPYAPLPLDWPVAIEATVHSRVPMAAFGQIKPRTPVLRRDTLPTPIRMTQKVACSRMTSKWLFYRPSMVGRADPCHSSQDPLTV